MKKNILALTLLAGVACAHPIGETDDFTPSEEGAPAAEPAATGLPQPSPQSPAEAARCQAILQREDAPSHNAAACAFSLAEQGFAAYLAIELPAEFDASALRVWFEKKQHAREEVSALYQRVAAYHEPEYAVAALARVGYASVLMAESLRQAPLPETITVDADGDGTPEEVPLAGELRAEVHRAVQEELNELSLPLLQDAQRAFSECEQGAAKHGISNTWSAYCRDQLESEAL